MQFRADLNGLRAIAVIAVVLFHFHAPWLPGGFAGVDVFFVISGFLMTGIILPALAQQRFSLWRFYQARVRRIVPALAVLCLALLLFGWFFTLDLEFQQMGKHVTSSVGFVSNVVYWQEAGYFDAGAHEKWLLHTWSLSAEWQFYLIYPCVLWGLAQLLPIGWIRWLLLATAVLGYGFSVYATERWPDPAYYLLPTRAWEMMLGGIAFCFPWSLNTVWQRFIEGLGLACIGLSYWFFSETTPWPGSWAALPVVGTFLVIQAHRQRSWLTNNPVCQKLGLWSYSIYLWHWPCVVFLYSYLPVTLPNTLLLMGLSIIAGMASYYWVERRSQLQPAVALLVVCLVSGWWVFQQNGQFHWRAQSQDPRNAILAKYQDYTMDPSGLFRQCNASLRIIDTGSPQLGPECISRNAGGVFIWGDSHMGALSTGVRQVLGDSVPFSQLTSSGCEPSFTAKRNRNNRIHRGCDYSNAQAEQAILIAQPAVVILGVEHTHEKYNWQETIVRLHQLGVPKVVIVGPVPQWGPSLPLVYVKRHMGAHAIADANFDQSLVGSNRYLAEQASKHNNFVFIDLLSGLCQNLDSHMPLCQVMVEDTLLAFDYGHLTVEGSRYVAEQFVVPLLF
ncbi:MAG: acyltransferase family protein [Ferrimonas sp.]